MRRRWQIFAPWNAGLALIRLGLPLLSSAWLMSQPFGSATDEGNGAFSCGYARHDNAGMATLSDCFTAVGVRTGAEPSIG